MLSADAMPHRTSALRSEVHVAGFWRRAVAAIVDVVVLLPAAGAATWLATSLTGVQIRASDILLDVVLGLNPAVMTAAGLMTAVAALYLLVFQIAMGRTVGMRMLGLRIIDVYGSAPSPVRCALRTAGYALGMLSFFLGFFWIGFDREKRGWHDWLAGTYVIID